MTSSDTPKWSCQIGSQKPRLSRDWETKLKPALDITKKKKIRDQNQRVQNNVFALAVGNAIIFTQTFN